MKEKRKDKKEKNKMKNARCFLILRNSPVFLLSFLFLISSFFAACTNPLMEKLIEPFNRVLSFNVTVINGTGGGEHKAGDTVTITAAPPFGTQFKDWTVNSGGVTLSPDNITSPATFTMPANNVTVTANFEPLPGYYYVTVTGGSGSGYYEQGTTVYITADMPPSPLHWFKDWTVNSGLAATPAGNPALFPMPSNDVSVTANYEPIPSYTVTYDGNSSTGGIVPVDSAVYLHGTAVTVLGNTGSLVRTGYTFAGWMDGGGTPYDPGDTFTITETTTLYAQWTINTYTVTYNGNGHTGGAVPSQQTQNYNTTVTVAGVGSLARTGHGFTGWNTQEDGGGTAYAAGSTFTLTGDVTLYAQWIPTVTVTFTGTGVPAGTTRTIPEGTSIGTANMPTSPVGTGYNAKFTGWEITTGGTGTLAATTPVDVDITVTAQFGPYAIGDIGPGNGRIFYAPGAAGFTVQAGTGFAQYTAWYLEAATADLGVYRIDNNTVPSIFAELPVTIEQTGIGFGRRNTVLMRDAITAPNVPDAANVALGYTGGGRNDWFMPSEGELQQLYNNNSHFGFTLSYLSSTKNNGSNQVRILNFGSGSWSVLNLTSATTRLIPIRAF